MATHGLDIRRPPRHGSAMSFVATLRAATAADHEMVDARFGRVALDDPAGYRRVLLAHGRALPAVEAALAGAGTGELPGWRPRSPALAEDLAALGLALPDALPFAADGDAERWGALYVGEGSRLGGQLLARSVAAGFPVAYLSSRHEPGEWRALLGAIEARAGTAGAGWCEAAIAGARATFALYARAAEIELGGD
ncbi:biliverdin-producing heme oxygenase [Sphingomonas sp. RP10(2022)]|uniref:Biliverdin-producing heme oxygenase n=1 Tax=Sphingomonas liriopis TaxID=2949094 RepID=A0A9X2KPQ4_9SPHN|nr:biliverdin-producing heme oxygenase [Sphingomonas liriopis]MCP3733781.1 biliverdin-producing heme oxygenase [Sphingomonas liriopis]